MKVSAADQQGDAGLWAVASKFTDELRWIFRPQPHRDLGIDGIVEVVEEGVSHGELLALQVKSGDSWFREETSEGVIFRFDEDHYNYWTQYPIPVLVVLHSPTENAAYWEIVNENTARNTGKGWKLEIQRANIVSIQNRDKIRQYCDFELQDNCYSVTSFKDFSHATAKRYEARVLLNKKLSRGEIVQVIARATGEFREREYYRSDLTQDAWRGKKANVVWLFVFPSLEDEKNTNWLCSSQWIDPSLDDGRSAPFGGAFFTGQTAAECVCSKGNERPLFGCAGKRWIDWSESLRRIVRPCNLPSTRWSRHRGFAIW